MGGCQEWGGVSEERAGVQRGLLLGPHVGQPRAHLPQLGLHGCAEASVLGRGQQGAQLQVRGVLQVSNHGDQFY